MTPTAARAWIRILRDMSLVLVATFIAIHETVTTDEPDWKLLGFAATLYGIPAALRIDERRFKSKGEDDDS